MKSITATILSVVLIAQGAIGQTQQKPQQEVAPEDVIRITTNLVQTDVVVTDKNEQIVKDLTLQDFELYDNGKKQEIKVMQFISINAERRSEGNREALPGGVEPDRLNNLTATKVRRVIGFVIDDLTMEAQDLPYVRNMLLDFVDNKMRDGDLVAIVRVVGGKGLLQQFTADHQLLKRAIAAITITLHPYGASSEPEAPKAINPVAAPAADSPSADQPDTPEIYSANDDLNRFFRGLSTLTTANYVISALRQIPGRKNLVIISGGIPIFENGASGALYSNISSVLNQLTDNAIRAGVVVNALDPRGLRATPGVVGFKATPAKSSLGGADPADATFGKGGALDQAVFGLPLAGATEHLGLSTVANATGGVSVVNTNNFQAGLDKIVSRSNGYYTLLYTPTEKFDRKFHKIEIKVKRSDTKVFSHSGYLAREERSLTGPRTKEDEIASAARSPLARNDIDVTPNIAIKLLPDNKAVLDIHLLIDPARLRFNEVGDRHETSLDLVGFVFDQMGRQRGGFSETVNLKLTADEYQRALVQGLTYSASTELPPGYYQIRSVVRESGTGSLGSFSKYLEIPDLTKGRLAMSSVFLFAVDATAGANPTPLLAVRRLNRKQELRYAAVIYNPKLKDGKPQLRSQMIVSQGSRVIFREPEQPVESNSTSPVMKVGQLGLARVPLGRYVLTLLITDLLADRKNQTQARSIDFTVVD